MTADKAALMADPVAAAIAFLVMLFSATGVFDYFALDERTVLELSAGLFGVLAGTRTALQRRRQRLRAREAQAKGEG